jgi:8-oxo-dGTP pyrophosphatase MutT (NUDIX family)
MAGDEPAGLHRWQRISSRIAYASPWTRLREDTIVFPNGEESTYSVFELGQCVGVLPILADGRVVLVRQYRYIGDHFPWEMPTGNLAPAESPAVAANRELGEEAGYHAATLEPLGFFRTSKGHCDEIAHLFVARELRPVESMPDATEEIERGIFVDSMTIIAVLHVALTRHSST